MRTPEEIAEQVQSLKSIKPRLPAFTDSCDDTGAAIEAQIATLQNRLGIEEILNRCELCETHPDYFTEDQRDFALEARLWFDGLDNSTPHTFWDCYIPF